MKFRATIVSGLIAATLLMGSLAQAPAAAQDRGAEREETWLRAHNIARAEFGVPALRWNARLAREARDWALRLASEGRLRHASIQERGGRGENLWMGTAGFFTADQMIKAFTDEKRYFRPGAFPNVSSTGNWADVGHYTQIVWAETRELGCSMVRNAHFDVLVCRYWPGGNVMGAQIAPRERLTRR